MNRAIIEERVADQKQQNTSHIQELHKLCFKIIVNYGTYNIVATYNINYWIQVMAILDSGASISQGPSSTAPNASLGILLNLGALLLSRIMLMMQLLWIEL